MIKIGKDGEAHLKEVKLSKSINSWIPAFAGMTEMVNLVKVSDVVQIVLK